MIPIAARNAAVYPRWRGEHDKSLTKNNSTPGLSPLARGTHHYFGKSVIKNRFIPAGAGNTYRSNGRNTEFSVYPRWRGEHYFCNAQRYSRIGLSPLARGTLAKQTSGYAWCRFIPAGAGNTKFILINTAFVSVYPRWRGEHFTTIGGHATAHGLSPLARGTQIWGAPLMKSKRFIPAGAGNTGKTNIGVRVVPVYPRWRGEHKIHIDKHRVCIGLSPLARGTLYYNRWTRYGARFIPAGAGNTNMGSAVNEIKTVYPRWRGEHRRGLTSRPSQTGLSPLARGTPVV